MPADADVVLSLQIYWIMICLPVMLLAAAIREREVVEAALDDQRNQLARVTRIATAGELSGALAHELRQPMTAILANAQAGLLLLAQRAGRPAADSRDPRRHCKPGSSGGRSHRSHTRTARGRDVTARAGRTGIGRARCAVLDEPNRGGRERARAGGCRGRTAPVRGDQVQLLQLLVNLVVNGCESMTDAAVTNRVLKLRVGRVGSDRLKVSVVDSGVGLPVDAGDRMFEPFFTTKASGLGLGLSISRSVAAAHGGRLWGENNGGQERRHVPSRASRGRSSRRAILLVVERSEGGSMRTRVCFKCW